MVVLLKLLTKISLTLVERYENPDKNSQFPVLENELQTFTLHTNVELKEQPNNRRIQI